MTDSHRHPAGTSWFEEHPRRTLLAVVLGFSLISGLVFGAVYLAWLRPDQSPASLFDAAFTYRRSSPVYHHEFSKNMTVAKAAWGERRYPLYTNSLGFKDATPRQVPLATNTYRLVFMGDSFTEGIGVAYPNTFTGRIAAQLAPCGIEVLNAAAVSYSPIIYWRKTKHLIEKVGLEFDEMIVFLDISDVRDEADSYYLDEDGHVQSRLFADRQTRKKMIHRIRKEKAVDSMARFMGILQAYARPPYWETGRWTIDRELFDKYGRPGLQQMDHYMSRLKSLLDVHNIRLTVAVYPWPLQLQAGDHRSIHNSFWRHWCRRHQVDFIDYFPVFFNRLEQNPPAIVIDEYFINGDAHWNRRGHRLVADIFCARFLTRHPCPVASP